MRTDSDRKMSTKADLNPALWTRKRVRTYINLNYEKKQRGGEQCFVKNVVMN